MSGGDFAAALAAGNPVIGKANSMHPGTTRLLAEEAQLAAEIVQQPPYAGRDGIGEHSFVRSDRNAGFMTLRWVPPIAGNDLGG